MKTTSKAYIIKRAIICICYILALVALATSCNLFSPDEQAVGKPIHNTEEPVLNTKEPLATAAVPEVIEPTAKVPEPTVAVPQPTAFEKNIEYLTEKGIILPELSPDSTLTYETFSSLLVETYEALGAEIDISKVNPRSENSVSLKKMAIAGIDNSFFAYEEISEMDYGFASYLLMRLQDSIQERLYWRYSKTATASDLLRRMNVSTALYNWSNDMDEVKTYSLDDLLKGDAELNQKLTRLMIAEMLVSAYEDTVGEIQVNDNTLSYSDTENINVLKASRFFFWIEDENFQPKKTGNWDDWDFISAMGYDNQLGATIPLDRYEVQYDAILAALVTLMQGYEGIANNLIEEKIVLNERPYDWHVNQQESGKYSDDNCMPACVEMALRFQGLTEVPSAEELRNEYPFDGEGWNDVLAENVMLKYGLNFTYTFDLDLDTMLSLLDEGNILYVMYRDLNSFSDIGHSVIIKGYWKLGSEISFIISDPNYNFLGPFGYLEYTKEAQTMISDMERHVPRYFVIPEK